MSMARSVVSGTIFRAPEERFTQNGIAVYSFVLNIGDKEEMLIRVLSTRTANASLMKSLSKGDKVVVEGRLQTSNVKMEDGNERKIYEIDASTIEVMGSVSATPSQQTGEISKFAEEEFSEELISEEEIPF